VKRAPGLVSEPGKRGLFAVLERGFGLSIVGKNEPSIDSPQEGQNREGSLSFASQEGHSIISAF
jgi:hypothetical protein